jgi:thioredoxin 1
MKIIKEDEFDEIISSGISLVDFYADWCGPCKMLGPVLEDLSNDYPDIKFVKVNCDDSEQLCVRYGILSIPTVFIFKDGQLISKTTGYQGKDGMKQFIEGAIK